MAFYIDIEKALENTTSVKYKFSVDEQGEGILELSKKTGEISIVSPMDSDKNGSISQRASVKIYKHWMKGEFPDKTCWAS